MPILLRYDDGLTLDAYLALEQQVLQRVEQPTLFTWLVAPTVIYGRHQTQEAEVNTDYCQQHNIAIVQRQSGGGCVYADEGNLMISLVTPSTHSEQVFRGFLAQLSHALQYCGLPAVTTAHNDILVGQRKVSGAACYTSSKGTIVHATLLYDVNLEAMLHAITPPASKLAKHGVASVRQRVANIKELTDAFASINHLRTYIERKLCSSSLT